MAMAKTDSVEQLGYVLHLLQDIKYFHQTNAHACTCDVCDRKISLVRSSIAMAIEKVNEIAASLHASQLLDSPENGRLLIPSNASSGSPRNPVIDVSSLPSPSYYNNYAPFDKQASPLKVEESDRCVGPPLIHQYASACYSLLSSTHRDSGVHTENFLHSSAISPIRSSGSRQDSSSESSDSDNQKPGYKQSSNIPQQTSPSHKTCEHEGQRQSKDTFEMGSEKQYNNLNPSQRSSRSYNSSAQGSCTSQKSKVPMPASTLTWPNSFSVNQKPFDQIHQFNNLPLAWPQFPAPSAPHFSSALSTASVVGKSPTHFPGFTPVGATAQPQSQIFVNNLPFGTVPYNNVRNCQASADYTCQESGKQPQVLTGPVSSQVLEINDGDIQVEPQSPEHARGAHLSLHHLEESIDNGVAPPVPNHLDVIVCKDVMLNDVRGPSEYDTVISDLSGNSSSTSQGDTSSDVNIKDVSGAMWRPWEAKEDVYKLISDLSIEEEDSVERSSSGNGDSLDGEKVDDEPMPLDTCPKPMQSNEEIAKKDPQSGEHGREEDLHGEQNSTDKDLQSKNHISGRDLDVGENVSGKDLVNEGNIREKRKQNHEDIMGEKEFMENAVKILKDVLSEMGWPTDYPSDELLEILKSPPKSLMRMQELIEKENPGQRKATVKSEGRNDSSQSSDSENGSKRKKNRLDKSQSAKENIQTSDLPSSPVHSLSRQSLSSTSLHDISNTLRQSPALTGNNHEINKSLIENVAEKADPEIEELTSNISKMLDIAKCSPTLCSKKSSILDSEPNSNNSPVDHGNQDTFFQDKNSSPLPSNPNPTQVFKAETQCFPSHVSKEDAEDFKRLPHLPHGPNRDDKAQGDSIVSDQTLAAVKGTHFEGINVHMKPNFYQNFSSHSDHTHKVWEPEKLRKSQGNALLASECSQEPIIENIVQVSDPCFDKEDKSLCLTGASPNTSCEESAQMPAWGAPAIVLTSMEASVNKSCWIEPEKDNKNTSDATDYENNACSTGEIETGSQISVSQARITSTEDLVPAPCKETGANDSTIKNDKRSRITALCHDRLQMQVNRDLDQLNKSFPVSQLYANHGMASQSTNNGDLAMVSFEGNQSFPKMAKLQSDPQDCYQTFGTRNHDAMAWCHMSTPLEVGAITPRNRRSVFGLSPPEQLGQHFQTTPGSHEKEQVPLSRESEASSYSSGLEDEILSFHLDSIYEAIDLSHRFSHLPSLKEILFNCVTDSICLIDRSRKGKIVSVNETFQLMIGFHEKIIGQRLFRFIKFRQPVEELAVCVPHKIILSDGSLTTVCGKQVSCVVSTGEEIPVSIWTVPLQAHTDLVACMINIAPTLEGSFYVNDDLDFIQGDEGQPLPSTPESPLSECTCGVQTGLLVVQSDGLICDFDYCFFHLLLGHDDLVKVHLADLLTHIMNNGDESKEDKSKAGEASSACSAPGETSMGMVAAIGDVSRLVEVEAEAEVEVDQGEEAESANGLLLPASCFLDDEIESISHLSDSEAINECERSGRGQADFGVDTSSRHVTPCGPQTSTPCKRRQPEEGESPSIKNEAVKLTSGVYSAAFRCGDGAYRDICFKVSSIHTARGRTLFCLWVYIQPQDSFLGSQSLEEEGEDRSGEQDYEEEEEDCHDEEELTRKKFKSLHLGPRLQDEAANNTSLGQMVTEQAALNRSHNAASSEEVMDLEQGLKGSFSLHYVTLATLGQGSFGFVRRARPLAGGPQSVVVKFIRKRSIFGDMWVPDGDQVVPSELMILRSVDHENIIKVLDMHQNEEFVQMVMEDFGEMDLFDFIDQVDINEGLACYIFRQIISGVDYLHSRDIVHRDIKDENVIINSCFHCKLIDFGSAAYLLPPGQLYTKFRGTLEYCSPEVHMGRGYRGPEVDAWALGVTLYTVVFRENPYTADCIPFQMTPVDFPFALSQDLTTLLLGLMCCDPRKRYSVAKAVGSDWLRQIVDISTCIWQDLFGSGPAIDGTCEPPQD